MGTNAGKPTERELTMPNYVQKRGAQKGAAASRTASRVGASKKSAGSSPKKSARKRRRKKATGRTWAVAIVLAVFAVALMLLFGGRDKGEALSFSADDNGKIYEGIYIENIYMGGKTADEARAQLQRHAEAQLGQASFTLNTPNGSFSLPAVDIGLSAGIVAAVDEAYALGRSGNLLENTRERSELKEAGKNIALSYSVQQAALLEALGEIKQQADVAPEEPYAIPSLSEDFVQSFAFYEGKTGYSLDVAASAALLTEAVARGELSAAIEPVYTEAPPQTSLEFIKENTRRISTFTTRFRKGGSEIVENRVFNIRKTVEFLNCHTVMPGEEFSYNGVVGPRTLELGWKEANGISGGKEYTLQAGGGVCQTSTTLYNALLSGNLTVTERRKHSIPSDYVDFGLDATVDTSGIDLKFVNDTGAPVYLFLYIKPDPGDAKYLTITVSLYGKPLPEGVTYTPRSVITETILQDKPVFTEDSGIPRGYQLVTVKPHDGFTAEAYLDRYVNGVLESSKYLYTDKYKGNAAEIRIGTGDPGLAVPEGATPVSGAVPGEG